MQASNYKCSPLLKAPSCERFIALWQRLLMHTQHRTEIKTLWCELDRRYSEPHRIYHTRDHISHCLQQFDHARHDIHAPDRVELALWFHDAIFDPASTDNEERSAGLFRAQAQGKLKDDAIDEIGELILITQHRNEPRTLNQQFICDIDLSSFGSDWGCFMQDSANVKAEIVGSHSEYDQDHARFLRSLLARPRIFRTDIFHQRLERQARSNISSLLRLLAPTEIGG